MTIDLVLGINRLFGKDGVVMSNTKCQIIVELKYILQLDDYAYQY